MPGRVYNELLDAAIDQYGFITPADAERLGVDRRRLGEMARRGVLEKVAWGVYRFPDPPVPRHRWDQFMEATLWPYPATGVISHASALVFYELCDVNPSKVHITLPKTFRIRRRTAPEWLIAHHRELQEDAVTTFEGISVVTPYRAILDGFETHLGMELLEQAIDTAKRIGRLRMGELAVLNERLEAVVKVA